MKSVILVEGVSDQFALEALARRRGQDFEAEDVTIVPIGGAQAIGKFVDRFQRRVGLAGMCDVGEARHFRKAFERIGRARAVFVCDRDLEDELIRALGVEDVENVLAARNELGQFRSFQQQPAWRGREPEDQLRRFLGTYSGRKIEIARMLVNALDLNRVPRPLDGVLAFVSCGR